MSWEDGYADEVEQLYDNVRQIGEKLLGTSYSRGDAGEHALEISQDIAEYLQDCNDLLGDQRIDFSLLALREEMGCLEGEKYSERAIQHMEMIYYTLEEFLEGERETVRSTPVNIGDSRTERHKKLAELTGELAEEIRPWSLP